MWEKASGHDWKQRKKYRLVHAAGSTKYIGTKWIKYPYIIVIINLYKKIKYLNSL